MIKKLFAVMTSLAIVGCAENDSLFNQNSGRKCVLIYVRGNIKNEGHYRAHSNVLFKDLVLMAGGFRDHQNLGEGLRSSVSVRRKNRVWPLMIWSDYRVNRSHPFDELSNGDEVFFSLEPSFRFD